MCDQMNVLVSVVIPTFNRSSSLQRAIQSVISQTYTYWELIVVDNSSTDDTLDMLNKFQDIDITIISVENNGVIGYSRNVGINNAKGKYVAFLDSDDWWEKDKLSKSVFMLETNKVDVVYHDCAIVSNNSKSQSSCRVLSEIILNDLVINGNALITSSVVVLKKAVIDVGCFSEVAEVIGWEDYHLWLKLANNNCKFYKIVDNLGSCWKGDDNFDNPERVLLNLVEIEKYFSLNYGSIVQSNSIWWFSYTRGRSYIHLNKVNNAKKMFWSVIFSSSPFEYKMKSLYFLFYVQFMMR